jgi:membrane-associated protease RseP (regulator of RpoE activity)
MSMKPTRSTWIKHALLLFATFITATLASTLEPFGRLTVFPELIDGTAPDSWFILLLLPFYYAKLIWTSMTYLMVNPHALFESLGFSISLLFILTAHEAGHYVACRIYRVHATLPFFMPTPPLIGPAGTLGAFIKILSPLPSRRAVFDIGVAGPIAGFMALIPVSILAMLTMDQLTPAMAATHQAQIYFSDPLYMQAMAWIFNVDLQYAVPNAFYYASWMGLLVTALNLIPSGQLDGGHANYAVFGPIVHRWTGRLAFVFMTFFAIIGFWYFNSPSGFLVAVLLGVMLRVGHPRPLDTEALDLKRRLIAGVTLLIFVMCFVPFPIRLAY